MLHSFRPIRQWLVCAFTLVSAAASWAHSVGQVQTTKYFAPETVQLLKARAAGGAPGFTAGDTLSYIIQFSPIANGANIGAGGYITDYIPPGTEVVGASIVSRDASGNYTPIAPNLPGGIDTGWGNRGQRTYLAPFAASSYDPTGRCAAAGYTNNCNGRLTEVYADTGIFFSTDARTAQFPASPSRIAQGTNGYNIAPTAEGQLNPIIGQAQATTHNLWDASMTNAFGSAQANINALAAPKSGQAALMVGTGAAPYYAGSAVAGPQTGYPLDFTGNTGPWQRIAYPGSRIGDPSTGPATAAGLSTTGIGGLPTSAGVALSPSSPLPAGTNAVRWAVGRLVVGEIRYVKISLRLTAPPPVGGIVNASEVFGGDAAEADNGQDNTWRYHVPSVADNNSNLFLFKEVVCVYSGTTCVASDGANIPANAKLRYRLTYLNAGNAPQTNLVLQDFLPCQTAANAATVTAIVSGPIGLPSPNPPVTSAGNCGSGARGTVTFPTLATLAPGDGGAIEIDIRTNAGNGDSVINTGRLTSSQVPGGITSNAVSTVRNTAFLTVEKLTTTPLVQPGGTVSYTLRIANTGTANATNLNLYDELPSLGGALNAATRFSYASTTAVSAVSAPSVLPAPVVTTAIPPTQVPYSTAAGAANAQEVRWNFGTTSVLAPGASFTLSFVATVGGSYPSSATTTHLNSALVSYAGGVSGTGDTSSIVNAAPVTVATLANLSVSKTNGTTTVAAGSTTTYTVSVSNAGPSAANGAVVKDQPGAGLSCTSATCTAVTGGAACPAALPLGVPTAAGSTALFSAGEAITALPASSSVSFAVTCLVTATGD